MREQPGNQSRPNRGSGGCGSGFPCGVDHQSVDAGTRANLGRLPAGENDWKKAAFHLQKATQMDPADANAHMAYSVALVQLNHLADAEKEAEAAVKASPGSSQAQDILAHMRAQRRTTRRS